MKNKVYEIEELTAEIENFKAKLDS
jgi:hypothetical protein